MHMAATSAAIRHEMQWHGLPSAVIHVATGKKSSGDHEEVALQGKCEAMAETSSRPVASRVALDQEAWEDLVANRTSQNRLPRTEIAPSNFPPTGALEWTLARASTMAKLRAPVAEVRQDALSTLDQTDEWSACMTSVVVRVMTLDDSGPVRRRACEVLAPEAIRGSREAIAAMILGLEDRLPCVREASLEALTCLATCGSHSSIETAADALRCLDVGARFRNEQLSFAFAAFCVQE